MPINELLEAVRPFLAAVQEALPQDDYATSTSEVENRMIIPPNTRLRDVATSAMPVHSLVLSVGEGQGLPEPAAISPPVVPYPYQPDQMIGGDSINAIKQRLLLAGPALPNPFFIEQAELSAIDLFEVKVKIISLMARLHPEGDWLGRGARALDNPRGITGEHAFFYLSTLLLDLKTKEVHSDYFYKLTSKVFLKR